MKFYNNICSLNDSGDLLNKQQSRFRILSLSSILTFLFVAFSASAQQNPGGAVLEVKDFLTSLTQQTDLKRNIESDISIQVKKLLRDIQPAVYLTNGIVKTYGESPVALYTDTNSLSDISTSDLKRSNIEIITIYVNDVSDLSHVVNTAAFSGFPNLKYVYIISNVTATDAAIIQMVQNSNPDYSVFYKIEKGA